MVPWVPHNWSVLSLYFFRRSLVNSWKCYTRYRQIKKRPPTWHLNHIHKTTTYISFQREFNSVQNNKIESKNKFFTSYTEFCLPVFTAPLNGWCEIWLLFVTMRNSPGKDNLHKIPSRASASACDVVNIRS